MLNGISGSLINAFENSLEVVKECTCISDGRSKVWADMPVIFCFTFLTHNFLLYISDDTHHVLVHGTVDISRLQYSKKECLHSMAISALHILQHVPVVKKCISVGHLG